MQSLYQKMRDSALKNSAKTAIVFYGKRYSFARVLSLVDKAAFGLKSLGVKKGDTVTLCMPNTPSAQIAFYALSRLGAIVNLVHPYVSASQLDQSIIESNSCLLIAYDLFLRKKGRFLKTNIKILKSRSDYFMSFFARIGFRFISRKKGRYKCELFESLFNYDEINQPAEEFGDDAPAVYLPSGGTSGTPKTIVHNCKVFNEICADLEVFAAEPVANYSVMLSVLPIFHGFGLCMNMHLCAVSGFTNVMSIKFDPRQTARLIEKERVNIMTGVPAMFNRLLSCRRFLNADLSSIKDCYVGGDSVPQGLVNAFNAALTKGGSKARLNPGYGLTETVAVCVVTCKRHDKSGATGYPLPGTSLRIMDGGKEMPIGEAGEICISTNQLMLGYLCDNTTAAAGEYKSGECDAIRLIGGERWLFTGDVGYVDGDGFLFFKQRIKNIIKVNGVPVYPSEIEEVALSIAGITRAVAVGIDSERTGQAVKLYVESKETDIISLKKRITEECRFKLMPYAIPCEIEVRRELPLNNMAKIDRSKL